MNELNDCIVLGAGPAGLSAALMLARYGRSVLTFHHSSPRNIYSHGVHGYLGLHGITPLELHERGRREVEFHGGRVVEAEVKKVEQIFAEHFRVWTDMGVHDSRRLVLATGLRDFTPDCCGFREFYGVSVHQCGECDGYENRGKRVAVMGEGIKAISTALGLLTWTPHLTVILDEDKEEVSAGHRARMKSLKIDIIDGRVVALEGDVERKRLQKIRFENGNELECDALFFDFGREPSTDFHKTLNCRLDDTLIWVDDHQETSVRGVYAVGDLTYLTHMAVVAAAKGVMAAIHLHKSLLPASHRLQ